MKRELIVHLKILLYFVLLLKKKTKRNFKSWFQLVRIKRNFQKKLKKEIAFLIMFYICINKISVSDQRSTCIRQIIDFRIRIEIIETQNLFEMENFLDKKKYHSLKLKFEERSLIFLENVKFSTQWWKIIHTNSDKVYARHYSRGKIYKCRSSTLFWYRNIDLVYFETRTISRLLWQICLHFVMDELASSIHYLWKLLISEVSVQIKVIENY